MLLARVEWDDLPVYCKQWAMRNLYKYAVVGETKDRFPTMGAFL